MLDTGAVFGQIFSVVKIGAQNFSDELLEKLRDRIAGQPGLSRRGLSVLLCQWLDWKAANGAYQQMAARWALLQLHRRKLIKLPKAAQAPGKKPLRTIIHTPLRVRGELEQLEPVTLVAVRGNQRPLSRLWNSLMAQHHPLGYQPMAGAQMRYLIKSALGWVGAIGFGAAAWSLRDRDQYIGWSQQARRLNLSRVVCNWRFLILPTGSVEHLFPQLDPSWGIYHARGWNVAKGERVDVTMLLKTQ